jgi:hypothetical protein
VATCTWVLGEGVAACQGVTSGPDSGRFLNVLGMTSFVGEVLKHPVCVAYIALVVHGFAGDFCGLAVKKLMGEYACQDACKRRCALKAQLARAAAGGPTACSLRIC